MAPTDVPVRPLNSGYDMPVIGLGTSPMDDAEAAATVASAIEIGYRLVDTAARYGNEVGVGRGLRASGVDRGDLFVTTKLRGSQQGRASTRSAVEGSLERLGLDYIDLYLIHWPLPDLDRYLESYETMLALAGDGLIRSVGVSNFKPAHIERLDRATRVLPAVNQIQLSPALCRVDARDYHDANGIVTQAYSPLGVDEGVPSAPAVVEIAGRYRVTPAQVILRWEVQSGITAVPKSSRPSRQATNLDVFSFSLAPADMATLSKMDQGEDAAVDSDRHVEY